MSKIDVANYSYKDVKRKKFEKAPARISKATGKILGGGDIFRQVDMDHGVQIM